MNNAELLRMNQASLANQIDWCRKIASLSGGCEVRREGYSYIKDAALERLCTAFDLTNPQYARALAEEIRTGAAADKLLTDALAAGDSTEQALCEAGFENYFEQTGMVYPMPEDPSLLPREDAEQLSHIRLLKDGDSMEEWLKTFHLAFQGEIPDDLDAIHELYKKVNQDETYFFFSYEENGETLGTSFVFFLNGVGGVHAVGTRPEARGRGIASALVKHILHLAYQQNCIECVLQASPMGRPVYERLGFLTAGPIRHWRLKDGIR